MLENNVAFSSVPIHFSEQERALKICNSMSLQPEEPKSVLQSFDLYSKLSLEI
jgi:hypothetical protein